MLSRRSVLALGGAACIGVGAYTAYSVVLKTADNTGSMNPEEALAAAALGDILLVDIRRPDEWQATGVPQHAVAFDLRSDDFLDSIRGARASATQPVALICARGVRSARTTLTLAAAGIGPIIDVPEGMLGSLAGPGWLKRGLPVVRIE